VNSFILFTIQDTTPFTRATPIDAKKTRKFNPVRLLQLQVINSAMSTANIFTKDNLAVISFSYDLRQASPFFLEKGSQGGMLDFASMSKLIGFNHKNQWHLRQRNYKYMFGFKEVYFDKNDFPHKNN